jgi:glycosyltransferase involved in cell wall biosynthesis
VTASISVIIPAYNGERFLREAVESALGQTLPPSEVIVVDDGSTDGTAGVARSLPVVFVSLPENRGISEARNAAIERARGDLIAPLDCDDVWLPHKLEAQVAALEAHPEAGYAVSHIRYFMEPGARRPAWFHPNSPFQDDDASYPPSTWLIRCEVFDAVGLFDVGRRVVEDIDWLARANDAGIERVTVPEPLVLKRVRDDSLTSNVAAIRQGVIDALRASARRKKTLGRTDR